MVAQMALEADVERSAGVAHEGRQVKKQTDRGEGDSRQHARYDAIDALYEEQEQMLAERKQDMDEIDALSEERERAMVAQMALEADVARCASAAQDNVEANGHADKDEGDSRQHAQWMSMFGIRVRPSRARRQNPNCF